MNHDDNKIVRKNHQKKLCKCPLMKKRFQIGKFEGNNLRIFERKSCKRANAIHETKPAGASCSLIHRNCGTL